MAQEIRQDIRLSQQLVMSPQLQLAIKLLQLSRMELVEMVREEVESNPVLEEDVGGDESDTIPRKRDEEKEMDWEAYLENCYERPLGNRFTSESDEIFVETNIAQKPTLSEYLTWQMHLSPFTQEETIVGEFIIGNIDENGYLRLGENNGDEELYVKTITQEIAKATGICEDVVETAMKKIQQFDPIGVGSRTLKECLLIQAEFIGCKDPVVAEIISNHLNNLEKKSYKTIATALKVPMERVIEAVKVIMAFSPRPGSSYGQSEVHVIIPDVYIEKRDGDYVIVPNENGLPLLKISSYYKTLIAKNGRGADKTKVYIQEKLRSALWLIKSIHQRQRTIYKVVQSIVKFQRDFFDNGACYLKPLILRDVATDIGMHESTVSRVTTNKYAHTPHGIVELKYFFSSGLNKSKAEGTDIAARSVMEKMKGLYAVEDVTKPFSDQKVLEVLKNSGIDIARRTVAKYREVLGILPACRRKRLF